MASWRSARMLNRMVKREQPLDATFAALADPTRRAIVERLSRGEASVSELAEPFEMSLPAVTKHLSVLEQAGLIASHKDGRVRHCELNEEPMRAAIQWIATYGRFWDDQLDSLARLLRKPKRQRR
jgi:DNA-binding transcriptional ArsR family regulator